MNQEPYEGSDESEDPLLAILSDERAFESDPARIAKVVEGVRRGRERQVARWVAAAVILIIGCLLMTVDPDESPPDRVAQEPSKTDWLFQLPDAAFRGPGEPVAMHDAAFEVAVLSAREQPRLVLMETQLMETQRMETQRMETQRMETRANGDDE